MYKFINDRQIIYISREISIQILLVQTVGKVVKTDEPISVQCCISYRIQSFDLQCNQITGFYVECNTRLKWVENEIKPFK